MDLQTVARICKMSPSVFARPASWRGRGWALDLSGRLDEMGRVRAVTPVNLKAGIYYKQAWAPKAEELSGTWFLVSAGFLATEYKDAMVRAVEAGHNSSGDTDD